MRDRSNNAERGGVELKNWILLFVGLLFWISSVHGEDSTAQAETKSRNPAALQRLQQAIQAQFKKDYPAAIAAYEEARKLDPSVRGVDYQLGVIAFNQGKFDEAKSYLEKSLATGDEKAASWNLLAVMAAQSKDLSGAVKGFQEAVRMAPADPNLRFNLSEAYREMGQPQEAAQALREAIKLKPNEAMYLLKLRLASVAAGDTTSLEKEATIALQEEKPNGDWMIIGAAIALKYGSDENAAVLLEHARKSMDPLRFFSIIQDPFFKAFSKNKDIAPFYDAKIVPN